MLTALLFCDTSMGLEMRHELARGHKKREIGMDDRGLLAWESVEKLMKEFCR
jgi:hypothetical protein